MSECLASTLEYYGQNIIQSAIEYLASSSSVLSLTGCLDLASDVIHRTATAIVSVTCLRNFQFHPHASRFSYYIVGKWP